MENRNEIVLKINRDEIYFSCKGYGEEFINAISDVINQRRRSLIESSSTSKLKESSNAGEILIEQKGKNPRMMTPRECARYMGLSDEFKIVVSDSQAYKQLGSAVVPAVV